MDSRDPATVHTTTRRRAIAFGALIATGGVALGCAPSAPATPAPKAGVPTAPTTAGAQPGSSTAPKAVTSPGSAPGAKKLAEQIVYAHTQTPPTFDPAFSLSNSGFMMARQVYDALVTMDPAGEKFVPQLASEWKRIDPLTMEFKLRDNVKFSNGEDFTAESVKWTVERLLASKNPNHTNTQGRMGPLTGVEVVNSTTVRLKTKAPDPILLNRLISLFMLPPKHGAQSGDDGFVKVGIGTGSYKGSELIPGQRMVFEAWEGSWRGSATMKKATWIPFAEPAAMIAGLRAGDIDIVFRVEPDEAEPLKSQFNLATQSGGSATSASIIQQNGGGFQDRRIRQALNYAVNKEEFVQKLLLGYGKVLDGQLAEKGMLGYHEGLKAYPYDPERAKALLREAGQPNLNLTIGNSASTQPITLGLAGYFQNVGINTKINVYEGAVSTRNINTKTTDNLYVFNRDYFHMQDYDIHRSNLVLQEQAHFPNEEFKKLMLEQEVEIDNEKRAALIKKASEILYNEAGLVFLLVRDIITPYTKKIANLQRHFDTSTHLWTVEKEA